MKNYLLSSCKEEINNALVNDPFASIHSLFGGYPSVLINGKVIAPARSLPRVHLIDPDEDLENVDDPLREFILDCARVRDVHMISAVDQELLNTSFPFSARLHETKNDRIAFKNDILDDWYIVELLMAPERYLDPLESTISAEMGAIAAVYHHIVYRAFKTALSTSKNYLPLWNECLSLPIPVLVPGNGYLVINDLKPNAALLCKFKEISLGITVAEFKMKKAEFYSDTAKCTGFAMELLRTAVFSAMTLLRDASSRRNLYQNFWNDVDAVAAVKRVARGDFLIPCITAHGYSIEISAVGLVKAIREKLEGAVSQCKYQVDKAIVPPLIAKQGDENLISYGAQRAVPLKSVEDFYRYKYQSFYCTEAAQLIGATLTVRNIVSYVLEAIAPHLWLRYMNPGLITDSIDVEFASVVRRTKSQNPTSTATNPSNVVRLNEEKIENISGSTEDRLAEEMQQDDLIVDMYRMIFYVKTHRFSGPESTIIIGAPLHSSFLYDLMQQSDCTATRIAMKIASQENDFQVKNEIDIRNLLSEPCPFLCPLLCPPRIIGDRLTLIMAYAGQVRYCPSTWNEMQLYTLGLLSALTSLHSQGVLHLDIKPSNIAYNKEKRSVTLIDLGCARNRNNLEFVSNNFGTPGYVAPELVRPSTGPLSPAADFYSAGIALVHAARHLYLLNCGDFLKNFQDLTDKLCSENPELRPVQNWCLHPFFHFS